MFKKYSLIANWKMYFSYQQASSWLETNIPMLGQHLDQTENISCVLCPSFEMLSSAKKTLSQSSILLGAQDCSSHETGAFTGQVAAQSLQEIGCAYCIVGHSESATTLKTDAQAVLKKINLLMANNITPIICLGESSDEYTQGLAQKSITQQTQLLCSSLKNYQFKKPLTLAYEPSWAIGSGKTPSLEQLKMIVDALIATTTMFNMPCVLLYGGSVTAETLVPLKEITSLQGFLLGKASTDFQELKKVVSLLQE